MEEKPFRQGIIAVIQNTKQLVLVAKRANEDDAWQFPQGGIDDDENAEETLFREVQEELGCSLLKILKKSPIVTEYRFPPFLNGNITKAYQGQRHHWYLCQYEDGATPNLTLATSQEFSAVRWVTPIAALKQITDWKKNAYQIGLSSLGLM